MRRTHRPRALARALLATLALSLLACGDRPAPPAAAVAKVVELDGEARVHRAGERTWRPLQRHESLHVGDRVEVRRGELQLEYRNGERHTLKKGTIIQFQGYVSTPQTTPSPEGLKIGRPSATSAS